MLVIGGEKLAVMMPGVVETSTVYARSLH